MTEPNPEQLLFAERLVECCDGHRSDDTPGVARMIAERDALLLDAITRDLSAAKEEAQRERDVARFELATAQALIQVLDVRLERFEETDPDGRALAEWAWTVAVAGSEPKNAARRYLSGIANRAALTKTAHAAPVCECPPWFLARVGGAHLATCPLWVTPGTLSKPETP